MTTYTLVNNGISDETAIQEVTFDFAVDRIAVDFGGGVGLVTDPETILALVGRSPSPDLDLMLTVWMDGVPRSIRLLDTMSRGIEAFTPDHFLLGSNMTDDTVAAAQGQDRFDAAGGGGDDLLDGSQAGNVIRLFGEGGDDHLIGRAQGAPGIDQDVLAGGDGDDLIEGTGGALTGGAGNDVVLGGAEAGAFGDDGNDHVFGGWVSNGGAGRDIVVATAGSGASGAVLSGGEGSDELHVTTAWLDSAVSAGGPLVLDVWGNEQGDDLTHTDTVDRMFLEPGRHRFDATVVPPGGAAGSGYVDFEYLTAAGAGTGVVVRVHNHVSGFDDPEFGIGAPGPGIVDLSHDGLTFDIDDDISTPAVHATSVALSLAGTSGLTVTADDGERTFPDFAAATDVAAEDVTRVIATEGDDELVNHSAQRVDFFAGGGSDRLRIGRIDAGGYIVDAGAGNDEITIVAGDGRIALDGGDGFDHLTLDLSGPAGSGGIAISFGAGGVLSGDAGGGPRALAGIEGVESIQLIGTPGGDTLTGGAYSDRQSSGFGNIVYYLDGLGGNDSLTSGGGVTAFSGGADRDTMIGGDASDSFHIVLHAEGQTLVERDVIDGGEQDDVVTFSDGRAGAADIDLAAVMSDPDHPVISGVEALAIHGSVFDGDSLAGSAAREWITGFDGGDRMAGRGGDDVLYGGSVGADEGGDDTAVYAGARAEYDVAETTDAQGNVGFTITHARGTRADGSDHVFQVERFAFADGTIAAADLLDVVNLPIDGPHFTPAATPLLETAAANTIVGTLSAADGNGNPVSFTLSGPDAAFVVLTGGNTIRLAAGHALDFEADATLDFTVTATSTGEGIGSIASGNVSVAITDVNERPTAGNATVQAVEDTSIQIDLDALGLLSDPEDDIAELQVVLTPIGTAYGTGSISGHVITFNPKADFAGPAPIGFAVRDTGGLTNLTGGFITVQVQAVPDAPVARDDAFATDEDSPVAGNPSVLADNGAGADHDVDSGTALSVVAVNGSPAAVGTFVTLDSGARLRLNLGGTFSYDPNGAFDDLDEGETAVETFDYTISDGQHTATATVSITINGRGAPVNLPIDGPHLTANLLPEDAAPDDRVGTLAATDGDGNPVSFALSGDDRLRIVGNEIRVADGAVFDFETEPAIHFTVTATSIGEGIGSTVSETFTLGIADVNEPIGVFDLDSSTVAENAAAGTLVGQLVHAANLDPDGLPVVFELEDGPNAHLFEIVDGTTVRVRPGAVLDYEAGATLPIRIVARSIGDPARASTAVRDFDVHLTDVNEAPTATDDAFATGEAQVLAGNVLGGAGPDTDPEGQPLVVTGIGGGSVGAPVRLASGALVTVSASGDFVYDPDGAFASLEDGQTASDSFTYIISDQGGLSDSATVHLTINGATERGVTLTGGPGADTLTGGALGDSLSGNGGNDLLSGRGGADTLLRGAGNDALDGGDGNDSLDGGADFDVVFGGSGADTLLGRAGNDLLDGGVGNDTLDGGDGNDVLDGGADSDRLAGGSGADILLGNVGNDALDGGDGNDSLDGGADFDAMIGGSGADILLGGAGNDRLDGGDGNDWLDGGADADLVIGGSGADILIGGAGGDALDGGDGNDALDGGAGNDALSGGAGDDVMTGGPGIDTFVFAPSFGDDVIGDFDANPVGGQDRVGILGAAFSDLRLSRAGNATLVTLGEDSIRLTGVALASVTIDDFILS
jgi:VCBS repeat-containing protein